MNTTCSQCGTSYRIPDEAIGPEGRVVRCAKCTASWRQMASGDKVPVPPPLPETPPAEVTPEAESLTAVPLEGVSRTKKQKKHREPAAEPKNKKRLFSALVLLAIILCLAMALIVLRKPIVHTWPASNRLYQSIGLGIKPATASLTLRNVQSVEMNENGQTTLHVSGEIVNTSDKSIAVPALKASLLNDTGIVKTITFSSGVDFLLPQVTHKFETSIDDAGIDAKNLQLSLSDQP